MRPNLHLIYIGYFNALPSLLMNDIFLLNLINLF